MARPGSLNGVMLAVTFVDDDSTPVRFMRNFRPHDASQFAQS
jgi:hypothetical protein